MINIKGKLTHLVRTLTGRRAAVTRDREMPIETTAEAGTARQTQPRRVATDIPLDRIENAYTPTQTSLKASFRTDGADRQRDQEFGHGIDDDRWNDEDRFTNKSGDPRIGTHGRTYEPGELRAESKEGGH